MEDYFVVSMANSYAEEIPQWSSSRVYKDWSVYVVLVVESVVIISLKI